MLREAPSFIVRVISLEGVPIPHKIVVYSKSLAVVTWFHCFQDDKEDDKKDSKKEETKDEKVLQNTFTGLLKFNLLTLQFLKWTLSSLNLDTAIVAKRVSVKHQEQNGKQCRS